jgi:hypothetical protein
VELRRIAPKLKEVLSDEELELRRHTYAPSLAA